MPSPWITKELNYQDRIRKENARERLIERLMADGMTRERAEVYATTRAGTLGAARKVIGN